jgi:hypothetical protein
MKRFVLSLFFLLCAFPLFALPPGKGVPRGSFYFPPAGGGGGADFVTDTFTGTTGTNLEAHTADTGGAWAVQGTNTTAFFKIDTNHAYCAVSGDFSVYYVAATPADANYSVHATVTINAGTSTGGGVAGRIDTATGSGYYVYYAGGAPGAWRLSKFDGATETSLGTFAGDVPTTPRVAKLRMNGSTISLDIDGVQRISASDSTYTATGKAGLIGTFFDNSTDRFIDNFGANDTP